MWFGEVGLGCGGGGEDVQALFKPAKVEPGENGTDEDSGSPGETAGERDGDGGEDAED